MYIHVISAERKPWVAEICGLDNRFGLQRVFVRPLRDYKEASRSWRGVVSGVKSHFCLREGAVYEVSAQTRRGMERRRFIRIEASEPVEMTAAEVTKWLAT